MSNKIDILYIIGRGSQWGNNELRFSLRSIAKYGRNINRVIIAGYIPRFVNRETCICLPIQDKTMCKHWNILNAIISACKAVELTDDFLYSSDDHFYFRDTDFANYPYYVQGPLPPLCSSGELNGTYRQTLINTRELLRKHGYDAWRYSWHGNTHMNRTLILSDEFQALAREANTIPDGCEPTCMVLNVLAKQRKIERTLREDYKPRNDTPLAALKEALANRECVSMNNEIGGSALHDLLMAEFPTKCVYEM